jgi:hypothetical protein
MPVNAMTNVDGDPPAQLVDQTAPQRYGQQLGLLADEDSRAPSTSSANAPLGPAVCDENRDNSGI